MAVKWRKMHRPQPVWSEQGRGSVVGIKLPCMHSWSDSWVVIMMGFNFDSKLISRTMCAPRKLALSIPYKADSLYHYFQPWVALVIHLSPRPHSLHKDAIVDVDDIFWISGTLGLNNNHMLMLRWFVRGGVGEGRASHLTSSNSWAVIGWSWGEVTRRKSLTLPSFGFTSRPLLRVASSPAGTTINIYLASRRFTAIVITPLVRWPFDRWSGRRVSSIYEGRRN